MFGSRTVASFASDSRDNFRLFEAVGDDGLRRMTRETAANLAVGDEAFHRFRQGLGWRDLASGSDVKFLQSSEIRNAGFVKTSVGCFEQIRLRDAACSERPRQLGSALFRSVCSGVEHLAWQFLDFIAKTISRKLQKQPAFQRFGLARAQQSLRHRSLKLRSRDCAMAFGAGRGSCKFSSRLHTFGRPETGLHKMIVRGELSPERR